jgi:cobalt-zinc-cadmium resistance protein CzcA
MGLNVADTYLTLTPRDKWRKVNGRPVTKEELGELIGQAVATKVPGQENLFTQPIEMRFNEMLEGSRADLVIKIFGHDFATLERLATEVRDIVEKIPGASEIAFDPAGTAPNVEIRPRREAMVRHNVHGAEVNAVIATALGGQTVGQFIDGSRRFPVVVRMDEKARRDLEVIRSLPVATHAGGIIRLEQVANVSTAERVNSVLREAGQRRAGVIINLRGRDIASFVEEATARIQQQVKFPEGYSFQFGGQFKNLMEAKKRLTIIVPLTLALIFVLIQINFGSLRQAVLIFLCVPLAVTGGIIALWLRGMPFTISAAVGFIALSGIAVLNGIMLLSFINQLRREGRPLHEAVVEGSLTRLRPKLMTALVASLGFVPMALSQGAGAEVQRPLATVVIGGIISSTFLTLVLLPTLYEWVEKRKQDENESLPENNETTNIKTV